MQITAFVAMVFAICTKLLCILNAGKECMMPTNIEDTEHDTEEGNSKPAKDSD